METVVNSAEYWTRWRASDDGELWKFTFESLFERRPAWCFDFCHRFVQIGKRFSAQPPDYQPSLLPSLPLSLSPPTVSSTPSSPLNYKPMLAHSRTTTEQRSRMDALELGNDSGSLSACRTRRLSPHARGLFHLDSTPRTESTRTGSSSILEGGLVQRAGKAGD